MLVGSKQPCKVKLENVEAERSYLISVLINDASTDPRTFGPSDSRDVTGKALAHWTPTNSRFGGVPTARRFSYQRRQFIDNRYV